MRLVLDTNIWLDWLVFNDPAVMPLKSARSDGLVRIAINSAGLEELGRILIDDPRTGEVSWSAECYRIFAAAVGHPVAVNPDRALRRIAAERNWPVLEFRRGS